jgi:hypothetical protein
MTEFTENKGYDINTNMLEIDDPFIYIEENVLSEELCKEIIERFENDPDKEDGITGSGVNTNIKNTTEIYMNSVDWIDIQKILIANVKIVLKKYIQSIDKISNYIYDMYILNNLFSDIHDWGFQIQKYERNKGHYRWHNDYKYQEVFMGTTGLRTIRICTFIFYLNNVNEGGETEFINGKIIPAPGKMAFFPCSWTYPHRGCMPISNDKYIITGWLGKNIAAN